MSHDSIIALIDKEIQRLEQARALLAQLMFSAETLPRQKRQKNAGQAGEAVEAVAEDLQQKLIAVRYLPPRRAAGAPRRPVGRPRKAAAAPLPGALGGTVPAGPVIISAGQVQQKQKDAAKAAEAQERSSTSPSLSVEMLTQRWLRN